MAEAQAIVVIVSLVLLNGLFVAAEFAIVGAPRALVEARAAAGSRIAQIIRDILRDPPRMDRFIATAQIGITAASLGLGMYGEHVVAEWIARLWESFAPSRGTPEFGVASVLAVALLTYVHIVVGEMIPKSIALQLPRQTAVWITPPMLATQTVLYPLVILLNAIGNMFLRAVGINRQTVPTERYLTPEELQLIVEESQEAGAIRPESARVLRELFDFGELTAGEVMVPRVRVAGVPIGTRPEALASTLARFRHSRYPVFEGDLDHILGMIHIKDLLRLMLSRTPVQTQHVRPVPVVPETARLDDVLETMRRERTQLAVVIDEHGGTAGIVTLEDLFEEVVGEIGDEPDATSYRDASGGLHVPGVLRLDELSELLAVEVTHEDVDSVSGLVLMQLGRPPEVGDAVEYRGVRFTVVALEGRGVRECLVEVLPEQTEGSATATE